MEPFGTSMTGFSGFCKSLSSVRTSTILRVDSMEMETITKTMATSIRLDKIRKL